MRETSFLPFGITKMMQTRVESSLLLCRVQLIFAFLLQRYKGLKRPVSFSSIFSSVSCDTRPILRQFPGDRSKTVARGDILTMTMTMTMTYLYTETQSYFDDDDDDNDD
jgi:hypothetical protein